MYILSHSFASVISIYPRINRDALYHIIRITLFSLYYNRKKKIVNTWKEEKCFFFLFIAFQKQMRGAKT